jgi:hypothetical protein
MSTIAVKTGKIAATPNRERVEKREESEAEQYNFHERLMEAVDDVENGRIAPLDLKALREKVRDSKKAMRA